MIFPQEDINKFPRLHLMTRDRATPYVAEIIAAWGPGDFPIVWDAGSKLVVLGHWNPDNLDGLSFLLKVSTCYYETPTEKTFVQSVKDVVSAMTGG